jgi:RNA recognition motif-containing protein
LLYIKSFKQIALGLNCDGLLSKTYFFLAKITEARIMKDLKNGGQSKGYAFVAFDTHEGALNALRKLVNIFSVF